jgi:hypothetical protein
MAFAVVGVAAGLFARFYRDGEPQASKPGD